MGALLGPLSGNCWQEGPWRWEEEHRLKPSEQSEWAIGRWNSKDTWLGPGERGGKN